MDKILDELNVYKTIARMRGIIPFRYAQSDDHMEFFFANSDMDIYGSTMNNYLKMLCNQRDMARHKEVVVEELIDCLQTETSEDVACEARLSLHGEEPRWYKMTARRHILGPNEVYLIGELCDISALKADDFYSKISSDRDALTGLLSKNALKQLLYQKCQSNCEGAFLDVTIDGFKDFSSEVQDRLVINVAQCLKRHFNFEAYVGRCKKNEFYVMYFGGNANSVAQSIFEEFKNEITELQGEEFAGKNITVSCGICIDGFTTGDEDDIREKAHLALLMARRKGRNMTMVYSEELALDNEDPDTGDADFAKSLVADTLVMISEGSPIENAIMHCFNEVGNRFEIGRIFVHELNEHTKTFSNSYNWYTPVYPFIEGLVQRNRLMEYDVLADVYKNTRIIAVSDAENYVGNEELVKQIQNKGIKSFVRCIFDGGHGIKGCVGFECYISKHNWTDAELNVFKLITQLVSSYLLNIREYDSLIVDSTVKEQHDPITGLMKYELFLNEASRYVQGKRNGQYAIVSIGLADFISVNSRYGYDTGNMLLKALADLFGQAKDRVVLASRVNADNFVILANTFDSRGSAISPTLLTTFGNVFDEKYGDICAGVDISLKAGIAVVMDTTQSIEGYIKKALLARGMARNTGRDVAISE